MSCTPQGASGRRATLAAKENPALMAASRRTFRRRSLGRPTWRCSAVTVRKAESEGTGTTGDDSPYSRAKLWRSATSTLAPEPVAPVARPARALAPPPTVGTLIRLVMEAHAVQAAPVG